jgi:hypothetical protein
MVLLRLRSPILRGALLISIASHVEQVLRLWCDLLHGEWALPRKVGRAPRGTPVVLHCMTYLRDVAGLAIGGFEQWDEWRVVEACKTARDCLAHEGGTVNQLADRATIERLPKVKVETSGLLAEEPTLFIDAGACEAAVDNARAFFDRLTAICEQDARAKKPTAP